MTVSMRTAGRYARTRIRERRRAFLRRHWWRLAVAAVAMLALVTGVAWWALDVDAGTAVAVAGLVVGTAFTVGRDQLDGTYSLVGGRDAERWTSRALRRALGRDWRIVDWISFEHHDVDHVVVGPGGVHVVESKFTDQCVDPRTRWGAFRIGHWTEQAERGARSVRLLLGLRGAPLDVLVVVWGAEPPPTAPGVDFVAGRALRAHVERWRAAPRSLSAATSTRSPPSCASTGRCGCATSAAPRGTGVSPRPCVRLRRAPA